MKILSRAIFLAVSLGASLAFGQFTGPAPLAWRWAASTVLIPAGNPTIDGDTIYLAMGNRIYGVNAETGNDIWRFPKTVPNLGYFRHMPVLGNGVLVTTTERQYAIGIDAKTGEQKWQHFLAKPILHMPIAVGKYFVF